MGRSGCSRRNQRGFDVEQAQRTLNLGQAFSTHVEIAGGRVQGSVTQQRLHDGDLDAIFQAMRGEAVTQRILNQQLCCSLLSFLRSVLLAH